MLRYRWVLLGLLGVVGTTAFAAGAADPVVPVLAGLVILFTSAKLGGYLAMKLHQPVVLGELVAGVIIGNMVLVGFTGFNFLREQPVFEIMASIGVVLLLFEVGLESSVKELMRVGTSSALVAVVGVVAPFGLGWAASTWVMPDKSIYVHAFVGATLCATSVGITARVLKDLGKIGLKESKIILGAAVIDDVLGLIILAVVSGIIAGVATGGDGLSAGGIAWISFKAIGFLVAALLIGMKLAPAMFKYGALLRLEGMLLTLSLSFCFLLSYLAAVVGLAPIVGAFAAGLIIDGTGFARYFDTTDKSIEEVLLPVSRFFVPLFFVIMGTKVDLATFQDVKVLGVASVLTLVALVSKQICGLGALGAGLNRKAIGIGMIPRGEVGLIFAMIGSGLVLEGQPIIDANLYSAIVIMVMVTTMVTPPALTWALRTPADAEAK